MRWPWQKPTPAPAIPPYRPVIHPVKREEPGIVVEEVDTSAMTQTGVHRAWQRLTGRPPREPGQ